MFEIVFELFECLDQIFGDISHCFVYFNSNSIQNFSHILLNFIDKSFCQKFLITFSINMFFMNRFQI